MGGASSASGGKRPSNDGTEPQRMEICARSSALDISSDGLMARMTRAAARPSNRDVSDDGGTLEGDVSFGSDTFDINPEGEHVPAGPREKP